MRDGPDALGNATAATHGRPARHQYPQDFVAVLAGLVEAREPMPGPAYSMCRAGPADQKARRHLVRAERRPTAVRLRRDLDRIQGRPRHQVKADPRPSPGLRLPDDVAERDR